MSKLRYFSLGLITLMIPLFLIMSSIRLLLTPLFLQVEYNAPGFPPDIYGFTLADRFKYATPSLVYLVNNQGIDFLAALKFDNGQPIYNERELSHMVDVKTLIQKMILGLDLIVFLLVMSAVWAWKGNWLRDFWWAVSRGGWLTLGVIALILVGVFTGFSTLFTEFHRIFFSGDTWLFLYTDTLIRLFPMRFWQDAFTLMGAVAVAGALLAAFGGRALSRRF